MSTGPPGDPLMPDNQDPLPLSAGRYDTFFVKVLVRRSGQIMQGRVTHVASHRTLRFKDPGAIVRFILTQVAHPADSPATPRRPEER